MNFPENYSSSLTSEIFTEETFKHIKKDKPKLLSFFKSALEDQQFWGHIPSDLKGRVIKTIKKQVSRSDQLSLAFVNSIQSISEKTFHTTFDTHGQIIQWLEGTLNHSEFLNHDLSTLVFYTKLMKNGEKSNNPSAIIQMLLNHKANLKKRVDTILPENITEKNFPHLLEIALNTGNRSLKNLCLNFLKNKTNLNHIFINRENKVVINLKFPLEQANLDKIKTYLKQTGSIEIKVNTKIKDFNEQPKFFNDFSKNIFHLILLDDESITLSSEIGNLTNLKELTLRDCSLQTLPESLGKLENLTFLSLTNSLIQTLPENLGNLKNLTFFTLANSHIQTLPKSIGTLSKLRFLNLCDCKYLQTLPDTIGNLTNLRRLSLSKCSELLNLPESMGHLENLEILNINKCSKLEVVPEWIGNLKKIYTLRLIGCHFSDFDKLKLAISFVNSEYYLNLFQQIFPKFTDVELFAKNLSFFKPTFKVKEDFDIQALFQLLQLATKLPKALQNKLLDLLKENMINSDFLSNFVSQNYEIIEQYVSETEPIILMIHELSQKTLSYNLLDTYLSHQKNFFTGEILKEYLITEEGKNLLIKHKENIFQNLTEIRTFVENTFPALENKDEFIFYPIQIEFTPLENEVLIKIKCFKQHLYDIENCKFILKKISEPLLSPQHFSLPNPLSLKSPAPIVKFQVSYRNERGIDAGGLTKDFMTTIFETISQHDRLFESVPKEEKEFQFLGPLLSYIFNSKEEYFTGEVFYDGFFKGMLILMKDSRFSRVENLPLFPNDDMITLLTSYNTKKENERIKNIQAFLEWNGLPQENFSSVISLVKFYHETWMSMDHQLKELVQGVSYKKIIEYQEFLSQTKQAQIRISSIKDFFVYPKNKTNKNVHLYEELESQLQLIQNWIKDNRNPQLRRLKNAVSKEVFIDYRNQLKNLETLLQSMHLTKDQWDTIKKLNWESFKTSIQGEFNKTKLLEKIEYIQIGSEFPTEIKNFFEKWIENTNEDELKIFLKQATGFSVVPIKDPIKLVAGKPLFQVHACFNLIDIPNDLSERQFLYYMKTLLADKEGAFHAH